MQIRILPFIIVFRLGNPQQIRPTTPDVSFNPAVSLRFQLQHIIVFKLQVHYYA